MLSMLTQNWWAVALRGTVAVIFGVVALVWPGIALETLILLFGFYALFDGISAVFGAFLVPGRAGPRWLLGLAGAASVAVGVFAFARPDLTSEGLLFLIAVWAVVTGGFEIAAGISFGSDAGSVLLWVLTGIVSIAFGGLLVAFPGDGILGIVWALGLYAIFIGVLEIVFAFKLRGLGKQTGAITGRSSQQAGAA